MSIKTKMQSLIAAANAKTGKGDADLTTAVQSLISESGDSGIWYPAVDSDGNISWARSTSETAPTPTNIRGPKGDTGDIGPAGSAGTAGAAGADGKSAYAYAVEGGYTGTETEFAEKLASEALIVHVTDNNGTLSADKTYIEIWNAILAGISVLADYDGSSLPFIQIYYNSLYFGTVQCDSGDATNPAVVATLIIEITPNGEVNDVSAYVEIPKTLPNPNAITFTGAVTGSYDGSAAMTVNIPSAVTDDHINSLIDTKLGVIENGSY